MTLTSATDLKAIKWNKEQADNTETRQDEICTNETSVASQLWRWLRRSAQKNAFDSSHNIYRRRFNHRSEENAATSDRRQEFTQPLTSKSMRLDTIKHPRGYQWNVFIIHEAG